MKTIATTITLVLLFLLTPPAKASLLLDVCNPNVRQSSYEQAVLTYIAQRGAFGMTCEQTKKLVKGQEIISITLMPVFLAAKFPGFANGLAANVIGLGLTTNPVVIVAVVGGGAVVSYVYLVMNQSIEDCEKYDQKELRKNLLIELRKDFEMHGTKKTTFEIKNPSL